MLPYFNEQGILRPEYLTHRKEGMPANIIVFWDRRLYDSCARRFALKKEASFECGPRIPVMSFESKEYKHAVVLIPFGGPIVSSFMEQACIWGCNSFIFFGSCCVIDSSCKQNIIVPQNALMDEGTGYHYKDVKEEMVHVDKYCFVCNVLDCIGERYCCANTWTTDAVFRETESAINVALEKGCICADMECSTIACVSSYLKVDAYQLFFAGDTINGLEWKAGSLYDNRKDILNKYVDIAVKISEEVYKCRKLR